MNRTSAVFGAASVAVALSAVGYCAYVMKSIDTHLSRVASNIERIATQGEDRAKNLQRAFSPRTWQTSREPHEQAFATTNRQSRRLSIFRHRRADNDEKSKESPKKAVVQSASPLAGKTYDEIMALRKRNREKVRMNDGPSAFNNFETGEIISEKDFSQGRSVTNQYGEIFSSYSAFLSSSSKDVDSEILDAASEAVRKQAIEAKKEAREWREMNQ